jgi:type III pantothenate kinase
MLLAIDVGNTNTTIGLLSGDTLRDQWRVTTLTRTTDELGLVVVQLLGLRGYRAEDVTGVIVSCVVPDALYTFEKASLRYLGQSPLVVGRGLRTGLKLRVDNPREVGSDRIVNAVAAFTQFGGPVIVVDLGTATTLDCVNAQGEFVGGVIAPGLRISAEALVARTSKLPRVEVARPKQHIGANTVEAMQSGLFFGYLGLVDRLARDCKRELAPPDGRGVRCVATGGFSHLVARSCEEIDEIDPDLTLRGLSRLYRLNRGEDRERPPG